MHPTIARVVPVQVACSVSERSPARPVLENFIQNFGGTSYDSGEMLVAIFSSGEAAEECAGELRYLYHCLAVEVDGEWLAVYLS